MFQYFSDSKLYLSINGNCHLLDFTGGDHYRNNNTMKFHSSLLAITIPYFGRGKLILFF